MINGNATLRNRAAGMARITLVPTLADLTARLADAEGRLAGSAPQAAPAFVSRRRPVVVDFISRRRVA